MRKTGTRTRSSASLAGFNAAALALYLRPAIRFHNGRELEMADVIHSLERLREQPLFSHLKSITSQIRTLLIFK